MGKLYHNWSIRWLNYSWKVVWLSKELISTLKNHMQAIVILLMQNGMTFVWINQPFWHHYDTIWKWCHPVLYSPWLVIIDNAKQVHTCKGYIYWSNMIDSPSDCLFATSSLLLYPRLVICQLGLAWKPASWLGFQWLQPQNVNAQAITHGLQELWPVMACKPRLYIQAMAHKDRQLIYLSIWLNTVRHCNKTTQYWFIQLLVLQVFNIVNWDDWDVRHCMHPFLTSYVTPQRGTLVWRVQWVSGWERASPV